MCDAAFLAARPEARGPALLDLAAFFATAFFAAAFFAVPLGAARGRAAALFAAGDSGSSFVRVDDG